MFVGLQIFTALNLLLQNHYNLHASPSILKLLKFFFVHFVDSKSISD